MQGHRELVLDLLGKSPEVGRLLVRLHDRNKLYSMTESPNDSARSELTQTIVDLLSFELAPTETELIADVLMGLIEQAENNLRRALAERLAVMEGVPLRIVLKLASDDIFVADPILRKSNDLKYFDLVYILKLKDADHWQAMATRPNLPNKLIKMLVETDDLGTSINLASNKSIDLEDDIISKFLGMAQGSDDLAQSLLMRDEIRPSMVGELYQFVGDSLKAYIKENFVGMDAIDNVIDEVVSEFDVSADNEYLPTDAMVSHAETLMQQGFLNSDSMMEQLKRGQIRGFIAQFSVYCGLPANVVYELLQQRTAQGMAIACKATHIAKGEFVNMYLLTSRVRGTRVISQNDLSRAVRYYDKVTEEMAKTLLNKRRH